jgi:hypothetical protein
MKFKLYQICALGLLLSLPAFAEDKDHREDKNKDCDAKTSHKQVHIPVVPEANPVWVLVPVMGAILLFANRKKFLKS